MNLADRHSRIPFLVEGWDAYYMKDETPVKGEPSPITFESSFTNPYYLFQEYLGRSEELNGNYQPVMMHGYCSTQLDRINPEIIRKKIYAEDTPITVLKYYLPLAVLQEATKEKYIETIKERVFDPINETSKQLFLRVFRLRLAAFTLTVQAYGSSSKLDPCKVRDFVLDWLSDHDVASLRTAPLTTIMEIVEKEELHINLMGPQALGNRQIERALEEMKRSNVEFVAIDLELTGISDTKLCGHKSMKTLFEACAESAQKFLIVQIGFCIVHRTPGYPSNWTLSPFNFYVYPSKKTIFSCDSKSLNFLFKNNFDFNRWICEGYDYERLQYLQLPTGESSLKDIRETGIQRLIECIIERSIPVVVHNGLLDIFHIYDKFISAFSEMAPEDRVHTVFFQDWIKCFDGGLYDTKLIAAQNQFTVFGIADISVTGLLSLKEHLCRLRPECSITVSKDLANSGFTYSNDKNYSHEAGFDAFVTAQVFILELEILFDQSDPEFKYSGWNLPVEWCYHTCFINYRNVVSALFTGLHEIDLEVPDKIKNYELTGRKKERNKRKREISA